MTKASGPPAVDAAAEPKLRKRRLRSDAISNREKLLASAHIVFAERGLAATLDDVARHAGIGVGTAYRQFPNKQALASEALKGAMEGLAADAEAALAIEDPWQSFAGFFETVVSTQSRHRGLHYLSASDTEGVVALPLQKRFEDAVAALFERARREGVIRADLVATDVGPILLMMRTIIDLAPPEKPDLWRRYLTLLLDGMRATPSSPRLADGLALDEFHAFISAKKRTVR